MKITVPSPKAQCPPIGRVAEWNSIRRRESKKFDGRHHKTPHDRNQSVKTWIDERLDPSA